MKKRFTFIIAAIAAIIMITQSLTASGQTGTTVTTTFTSSTEYTAGMTLNCTEGGLSWITSGKPNGYDGTRGIQYSKTDTDLTTTIPNVTITKVVVTASTNADGNTISVSVGETLLGDAQSIASGTSNNNTQYTFDSNSGTGEIKVSCDDDNKSLYVKSIAVTYVCKITYNANNATSGTAPVATTHNKGTNVTLATNTGDLQKTGYSFNGWNDKADGTGNHYNAGGTFTNIQTNVTLYAEWEEAGSDPSFIASDITIGKNETEKALAYTVNNPVTGGSVSAAIKTSSPSGWLTVGAVAEPTAASSTVSLSCSANTIGQRTATVTLTYKNSGEETLTTKDVSVTQDPATYTVTYYANGGTGDPIVDGPYEYGTDVNAITNTFTAPAKKQFAWWGDNELGDEDIYDEGDPITGASGITGNIVLYAIWEVLPTYSLVTSTDQIVPGAHYIIASSKTVTGELVYDYAMGAQSGNTRPGVQIKVKSGTPNYIEAVTGIKEVVLSGPDASGKWTMYDEDGVEISSTTYHFVASTSGSSNYITATNGSTDNAKWSVEFDKSSGQVKLTAASGTKNLLKMNDSSHAFTCYGSTSTGVSWGYLYKKDNDSNIHPYSSSVYNSGDDVTISDNITLSDTYKLTIGVGAIVRFTGTLATANATNLVIEDGGQLILANTNTGVAATVKKDVSAATAASKTDATYWYAISAGVENPSISSNTNLITESAGDPTYDLYRFNEEKNAGNAWENYRNSNYSATFTTLEKGRGYLYRNASALTITMTGDINVEDFEYDVTKTGTGEYAGFNLIGNPYTHNIYKGTGTAITNGTSTLSTGFYYLEPSTGKWAKGTDQSTAIAPNQGILVQVNETGNINMTNTNSNGSAKSHNDYIMLSVANSQYSDEAYAWFDKGIGLNKIEHRNSEIPMLYINQNGENFAIATMSDETQSFNLNFKATTMGKYTLSYETKGEYSYLHVIDRLTGEDVDMLMDGEYSFIASPSDSENRFIVRLEYSNGSENSESSIFAYQSGSDIIVNGEGELQIFDVTGRMVQNMNVNGVETISVQSHGVYIFKLNEKVQKIVVR